jgi:hypothetical protein
VNLVDGGTDNGLLRFAALVSLCSLLITSDSLALHVALARDVRTVAFFAPTSAAEIELYGLGEKVVSTARDYCSYKAGRRHLEPDAPSASPKPRCDSSRAAEIASGGNRREGAPSHPRPARAGFARGGVLDRERSDRSHVQGSFFPLCKPRLDRNCGASLVYIGPLELAGTPCILGAPAAKQNTVVSMLPAGLTGARTR